MKQFVYVFSEEAKIAMLKAGYYLLRSDDGGHVYIFKNMSDRPVINFGLSDSAYVLSDTLTF